MRFLIVLFSLVLLSVSCTDNKDESQKALDVFKSDEYLGTLKKIESAIQDKERGVAFSSYSKQDETRLQSALETAKGALLTLSSGSDVYSVYVRLGTSIQTYDQILVLERDQGRLDEIFNELKQIYNRVSRLAGQEPLAKWNLYNYNFSAGFEPEFKTYAPQIRNKSYRWTYNKQIDVPKASVGGPEGANSWLVSKTFNLSQVKDPSFRFFTVLTVNNPDDPTVSLKYTIENVFKVYVVVEPEPFTDYSKITSEDVKNNPKIFQIKYSADEMPLGSNFHKKWTPSRSLEAYKDKPLALAFHFDPPKNGPKQYHLWQILDVEINGSGEILSGPLKAQVSFNGNGFPLGFHPLSFGTDSTSWTTGSYSGKGFVKASSDKQSDAWILSPKFFLDSDLQNPVLNVMQTFNIASFESQSFSKMQILVSDSFSGGNPVNETWTPLDYSFSLEGSGQSAWNDVFTKGLDLSNYVGKEIVVAFRYQSEEGDKHTWQVSGFSIESSGKGSVTQLNYNMGCFEEDPFQDDIIYSFSLDEYSSKDTQTKKDSGNPPFWTTETKENGACIPKAYFYISGYAGSNPKLGVTRKILPALDLSGVEKASLRLLHSLAYSKGKPESLGVQISLDKTDWEFVGISGNFKTQEGDNVKSDWVKIDEKYMGQKVYIAYYYHSFSIEGGASTPNWSIKKLEVKEDKE